MFTGIIEGIGVVRSLSHDTGRRSAVMMTVDLGEHIKDLKVGESVAVNGVCLTATKIYDTNCIFEMIQETALKTSLGGLDKGDKVNIERSLKAGARLEGHFVLGHVDGTGTIRDIAYERSQVTVQIQLPEKLARYVVKKGSIAVDGISLTIVEIKDNIATISLIPHTVQVTNFAEKKVGDKVNIETDILGKYIIDRSENASCT